MTMRKSTLSERDQREEMAKGILDAILRGDVTPGVSNSSGTRPIVMALEHELLSAVASRVESVGGSATVYVRFDDGRVSAVALKSTDTHAPHPDAVDLGPKPVNEDIELGMLLAYVRSTSNGVVARVAIDIPDYEGEVESVPSGELQLAR